MAIWKNAGSYAALICHTCDKQTLTAEISSDFCSILGMGGRAVHAYTVNRCTYHITKDMLYSVQFNIHLKYIDLFESLCHSTYTRNNTNSQLIVRQCIGLCSIMQHDFHFELVHHTHTYSHRSMSYPTRLDLFDI